MFVFQSCLKAHYSKRTLYISKLANWYYELCWENYVVVVKFSEETSFSLVTELLVTKQSERLTHQIQWKHTLCSALLRCLWVVGRPHMSRSCLYSKRQRTTSVHLVFRVQFLASSEVVFYDLQQEIAKETPLPVPSAGVQTKAMDQTRLALVPPTEFDGWFDRFF